MSDPTHPYGPGGHTPYGQQAAYGGGAQASYGQMAYGEQPAYGQQPTGGAQASYGQMAYGQQAAYGQPAYGGGAPYGQPAFGQVPYVISPALGRLRSNASMVRIMAFVSFATLGPFLSFGAWLWGISLKGEAERLNAPDDIVRDVRGASMTALVCGIVEVVLGFLFFVFPFFVVWLTEA